MVDVPSNFATDARFEGLIGANDTFSGSFSSTLELAADEDWIQVRLLAGTQYTFTLHEADIARYQSAYLGTAGLSFERDLGSTLTLDTSAGASWSSAKFNETYVGLGKSGLSVVEAAAGLTMRPGGSLYMRPHVELSALLDDELSGMVESPTILSAGFAFGAEF